MTRVDYMPQQNEKSTSEGKVVHLNQDQEPTSKSPKASLRSKGIYLLPNLFTTGALFSGFYAVVASMNGHFEKAAIAIFVAMILDGRADYFLAESQRIFWSLQQSGKDRSRLAVQDCNHFIADSSVHLAFNSSAPSALQAHINERLDFLLKTDFIAKRMQRYTREKDHSMF